MRRLLLAVFLVSLIIRLFNAFTIRTFFQPDEYFQALEPAHKLVFGYGYITWEWTQRLRSALHPLIYAGGYQLMYKVLPPSKEDLAVEIAPKLVSSVIAALGDTYTYRFAASYTLNDEVAMVAWILSLASSWNWYVSTRSFSNNLELMLTTIGLSYWPWHRFKLMSVLVLTFFGFHSCLVRPTNSLLWGYLGGHLLLRNRNNPSRIIRLSVPLGIVFGVVVGMSALVDWFYYGEWTFPAVNFLEFNVVKNLLVFYGAAPWHFYLLQGLPLMLMGYLPIFLSSLWSMRWSFLSGLTMFVTGAFSAISHKEFRFLQPIYPVMLVLTAVQAHRWRNLKYMKYGAGLIIAVHIFAAFFFTQINEVGEIDVVRYLKNTPTVLSVGFLTPCHSTPWHSMLHRRELVDSSWFLTCEPPLHLERGNSENVREYRDELDWFFDDPVGFLDQRLPRDDVGKWPSHIVIFEPMETIFDSYVNGSGYEQCTRFFNSYFHWDDRRRGDMIVYCDTRVKKEHESGEMNNTT
ncbi:CIC11C00000002844 [Sungouiella intermedia]|uniref:Mannosyltransferase n=1 Tax=Sungouiella intermedia TaxID=45354 RepID=A0A1L0BM14_9ASCO|nr:CIC11C00000002844 [[Candida] intermedia]